MIKVSTSICLVLGCLISYTAPAQNVNEDVQESGGEYPIVVNDAAHPCISPAEYERIASECAANRHRLGLDRIPKKAESTPLFEWPLRMANGLNDCSYYLISAYVDEDTTATHIKDWHCGTVTYDGHLGTDIATFPYPFYKLDNNLVEVIAAAPGTIMNKVDGNTDKNCAANSLTANYIVIQHADGSAAYYFHMKKNSLTSKAVGQTVAMGEYLGVVASSGDATGPHLHFEVRTALYGPVVVDPWAGTCNIHNAASWWASQTPYTQPAVIRTQINNIPAVFPACPATETPNDSSCFAPGASVKLYAFIRNETPGLVATFRIVNPNGSVYASWTHTSATSYTAAYYTYTHTLPATAGVYTFQAIYNGDTCARAFTIGCSAGTGIDAADMQALRVYPNPTHDKLNISGDGLENGDAKIMIKNMLGQSLLSENIKIENNTIAKTMSIAEWSNGLYFLTIETGSKVVVRKIEKE
jgi:murein DD-endopeptidase MepM/ murein hydrolase activator NlpD